MSGSLPISQLSSIESLSADDLILITQPSANGRTFSSKKADLKSLKDYFLYGSTDFPSVYNDYNGLSDEIARLDIDCASKGIAKNLLTTILDVNNSFEKTTKSILLSVQNNNSIENSNIELLSSLSTITKEISSVYIINRKTLQDISSNILSIYGRVVTIYSDDFIEYDSILYSTSSSVEYPLPLSISNISSSKIAPFNITFGCAFSYWYSNIHLKNNPVSGDTFVTIVADSNLLKQYIPFSIRYYSIDAKNKINNLI